MTCGCSTKGEETICLSIPWTVHDNNRRPGALGDSRPAVYWPVSNKTILAVVSDLMFQSRLRNHARALGYELVVADTPASVRDGLERLPALLVLDLHVGGLDWRQAVEAAKAAGVPVLAFGRHTEARLLRSAREAGCGRVVPRSTFVEELPRLIEELTGHASPQVR